MVKESIRQRTPVRVTAKTMAAAVSLTAVGLALTACQPGTSAAGSGTPSSPSGSAVAGVPSSAAPAGAASPSALASATPSSSPPPGAATAGATPASNGSITDCQASNLKASIGVQDPDENSVPVNLQNTGPTCVMAGFPGVDASGNGGGEPLSTPVSRDGESYSQVTLNTNQYAQFVIKYAKGGSSSAYQFSVSFLTITPPNTTSSLRLNVPSGTFSSPLDFNLQTTDQLPGTTITPITTGPGDPSTNG